MKITKGNGKTIGNRTNIQNESTIFQSKKQLHWMHRTTSLFLVDEWECLRRATRCFMNFIFQCNLIRFIELCYALHNSNKIKIEREKKKIWWNWVSSHEENWIDGNWRWENQNENKTISIKISSSALVFQRNSVAFGNAIHIFPFSLLEIHHIFFSSIRQLPFILWYTLIATRTKYRFFSTFVKCKWRTYVAFFFFILFECLSSHYFWLQRRTH